MSEKMTVVDPKVQMGEWMHWTNNLVECLEWQIDPKNVPPTKKLRILLQSHHTDEQIGQLKMAQLLAMKGLADDAFEKLKTILGLDFKE